MEDNSLGCYELARAALDAASGRHPWTHGPVKRGATRDVFISTRDRVVVKVERVGGANRSERHELELCGGDICRHVPDWAWLELDGRCVLFMRLIDGTHPDRVDGQHPVVRRLRREGLDVHRRNLLVDADGKLWCIDLGA